jgi:hypothetical protein
MQTLKITYDPVLGAQYSTEQTNYVILRPHYEKPVSSQNTQAQTPEIQRTYRQKAADAKSPKAANPISAYKILTLESTCAKTESIEQETAIKDSILKRRMQPMTSGQRHIVKQNLKKMFIGSSEIDEDIDEAHFEMVSHYTPRTRHFEKPVAHNILTLPEYQQRKKEILRSGVPVKKDKNVMRIYVVRKNYKTVWAYFEPIVR